MVHLGMTQAALERLLFHHVSATIWFAYHRAKGLEPILLRVKLSSSLDLFSIVASVDATLSSYSVIQHRPRNHKSLRIQADHEPRLRQLFHLFFVFCAELPISNLITFFEKLCSLVWLSWRVERLTVNFCKSLIA